MEILLFILSITIIIFAVKNSSKLSKLRILRYAAIFALTVCINIPHKKISKLRLPMMWLRHYIIGSGTARMVPTSCLREAASALVTAVVAAHDDYNSDYGVPLYHDGNVTGSKYCLYHSTLYDGAGFSGRPTLFYLLGGFTFLLRRDWKVSGRDRYDWHANEDGTYFASPLGSNKYIMATLNALNWVFGNGWFGYGEDINSTTGEAGISNKLWCDMKLVGAKEFTSWFKNQEVFSDDQIDRMIVSGALCQDICLVVPVKLDRPSYYSVTRRTYRYKDYEGSCFYMYIVAREYSNSEYGDLQLARYTPEGWCEVCCSKIQRIKLR